MRLLGRTHDLRARAERGDEQRLDDVVAAWSLGGNRAWLVEGVRRGEPFLLVSPPAAGSVLAWELEQLASLGYLQLGPLWVPVAWLRDAACYRRVVTLIAAHVGDATGGDGIAAPEYVAKAAADLEPLLRLWPHVLALPTSAALAIDDLVLLRSLPVHPLGVVDRPAFGDGALRSPAEFFFHDVDHARFKLREDLLAVGIAAPDAYVDGTTWDGATGRHRAIVDAAGRLGGNALQRSFADAPARLSLARALLGAIAVLADRALAEAARWLLFEIVHEKSFPLVPAVLLREGVRPTHVAKLRDKAGRGFFGDCGPTADAIDRLDDAGTWLMDRVREAAP